ncbi:MAG TPA: hypothetical protein VFS00_21195, partial [Polyangiaceae bacterium]|nr:hypothetical protein [Polyangiaceae bacterium]
AIGLFNRFDLAPADGSNCGEHRIIFARRSGVTQPTERSLVIFEAVLDNPDRAAGLEGCRPVAEFWAGLSSEADVAKRAGALKGFYFTGLPGFQPVVHLDNLGNPAPGRQTGQVRTNQFMGALAPIGGLPPIGGQPWLLRELKLVKSCAAGSCALEALPDTVKTNPGFGLFSDLSLDARRAPFQDHFVTQVGALAVNDVNGFNYAVPDAFNAGESQSQGSRDDYGLQPNPLLTVRVQAALSLGSGLTARNIIDRATALSCAGCHQLSNGKNLGGGITWPSSLGFVHVSEAQTEAGEGGPRFAISPALTDVFLPRRKAVFEAFLNGG